MKNTLLLLLASLVTHNFSLAAQSNDAPEPWFSSGVVAEQNSLVAAFTIDGAEAPEDGTTDWVGAVDGDDAGVLLGFSRADVDGSGTMLGAPSVNEPTGASNTFHLVYYDASTMMFHILLDDAGDPLEIPWTPDDMGGVFVDGYNIGASGSFPGAGTPVVPGETEFEDAALILPVELTAFAGAYNGKGVDLGWKTASEEGNDYFAVERSTNATDFREISRVDGRNTAAEYDFTDEQPATGFNYYRLRQTDLNGEFAFSEVIQVFAPGAAVSVSGVYPNPAANTFNLQLSGQWGETVNISLLDASGRTLRTWKRSADALTELDVHAVNAGAYQVVATDGKQTATTRLIINR